MDLFPLNIEELDRIHSPEFILPRRIVYSEQQVNKAIFRVRTTENEDHDDILASERMDMSSLINGGAGTGKSYVMMSNISSCYLTQHFLVT